MKRPALSLPISFEPNSGQNGPNAEMVGRGGDVTVLLTRAGMEFVASSKSGHSRHITIRFVDVQQRAKTAVVDWQGVEKCAGETNYLLGNDPSRWRTHVPRFGGAVARNVVAGVDAAVYGNGENLEYDLRVARGTNPTDLRLGILGTERTSIDSNGDLVMTSGGREMRMRQPVMYVNDGAARVPVDGGYAMEADGTIGFRVGDYDHTATLVIDPSLSIGYATFLGGAGTDSAAGVAVDATGKVYVGGTTASVSTFPETSGDRLGATGGASDFFIAKLDPTKSGADSLVYLTFVGGSGSEAGGAIAVDSNGNVVLVGTTTSADYPVTDTSTLTTGSGGVTVNDAAVTEIDPTGAKLVYSTLFGGDGNEATIAAGAVAFDSSGNIFLAMDTQSTNLSVTPATDPGPFQPLYGGGVSDGFLAIFQPVVTGTVPHLKYCTYLGISAQATVTGVAVDSVGNAYLVGYTSNPFGTLATPNGFQTTFGGGTLNGFVMKILPSGNGTADLSYGTFLGGSGSDQAMGIAVGKALPGTAYVTGMTTSPNFPVNGSVPAFQANLNGEGNGNANAFVSAIAQLPNGTTVLSYSTYLGGSQTDAGLGIFFAAANQIYVTGSAKSWDFPWRFNFQPFSGDQDAFVVKMDPTSAGAASLLYSTPIGGNASPGVSATAQGNGIAVDASGNFYVAGATTAGDFPLATVANSGVQMTCASCQQTPPLNDAFVVEGVPSSADAPSISFNVAKVNFGAQPVNSMTVPPQAVAAINTGGAPLAIAAVNITGTNATDFSLIGASACMTAPITAGQKCSFEVGFVASMAGPEEAFLTFTDNGPEGSQTLEVIGSGEGPFAMISPTSVNFGSQLVNSISNMPQEVTVTNTGTQALQFSAVAISGVDASQFPTASEADMCAVANSPTLQPGQFCVVALNFAPTQTGTVNAEVDLVDNSGGVAGSKQVIQITGVGSTTGTAILGIAPTALNFGSQQVGVKSGSQIVTFTNSGSADLNFTNFAITGNSSTSFGFVAKGANACPLPSGKLVAGGNCTLSVDFDPNSAGPVSAVLTISDNAQGSPQSVALSGNGGTTGISITPASVNFAVETVGSPSPGAPVTIVNTGTTPIVLSVTVVGADPKDFSAIETPTCPQPLGAGNSCVISAVFDPVQAGNRSAAIQISDNAPGSPQTIPVSGPAVQATATITPANLMMTFGPQLAGTTSSAAQNVTITNGGSGSAILTVNSTAVSPALDFSLANNCKSGLAAGKSCTIGVTFTPPAPAANTQCGAAAGTQTSTLSIFDNDPNSPQVLTLSGTAQDYCLVPSSAISATVSSGSTGEFQLAAQSAGFAGAVALTCSGSVPEGTCTVSPASVTLAAGAAPIPFQVNLTTTAQPTGSIIGLFRHFEIGVNGKSVGVTDRVLMFLLLGAFVMAGRLRRRTWSLRVLETCAIFIILSVALVACGGGSQGAVVSATGTTPGTYPLTITGTTTGGATRTIALSLTVQ